MQHDRRMRRPCRHVHLTACVAMAALLSFGIARQAEANLRLPTQRLVRVKGLEPPRLAALDPKSSASTSFATPAALSAAKLLIFNEIK
jgi:hypothetical protein